MILNGKRDVAVLVDSELDSAGEYGLSQLIKAIQGRGGEVRRITSAEESDLEALIVAGSRWSGMRQHWPVVCRQCWLDAFQTGPSPG